MKSATDLGLYHTQADVTLIGDLSRSPADSSLNPGLNSIDPFLLMQRQFSYQFENFFHPFLAELIRKLNETSVAGLLDPDFLSTLLRPFAKTEYNPRDSAGPVESVTVTLEDRRIDVSIGGPYANYNWELLFHIPVAIAVHLSQSQRFAEAQSWFHLVFDPTNADTAVPTPQRYWRSFVFHGGQPIQNINTLLTLLSTPDALLDSSQLKAKSEVLDGYDAIRTQPFNPHLVAQSRPSAYQWYVVMKYLDNLIAWGDSLFQADTVETINEATLCYVLAAEILGPAPQNLPQPGAGSPRTFRQLKTAGLDQMSNAMIDLESHFPFNLVPAAGPGAGPGSGSGTAPGDLTGTLFGLGRSLYFRIPTNQRLLSYWDTVADRLFKIRNSENILGQVQRLPLFQPPLDPGMLVRAAAAGIDIGSIVSGLNQPAGPTRAPVLIQKSLELAAEVRSLGSALLGALEKSDAEMLALVRQGHEVTLQQMTQDIRFLQWQQAKEATNILLKSHAVTHERYSYYLRLLNQTPSKDLAPETFTANRARLTEQTFDDVYSTLVGQYDLAVPDQPFSSSQPAQGSSPAAKSGASGTGQLYLNDYEHAELNTHMVLARDAHIGANVSKLVAASLTPIPSAEVHLAYWGMGGHSNITSGQVVAKVAEIAAQVLDSFAAYNTDQASIDSRTAGYQRRADEWTLQANLAARELMQIGRQIISSLIAEQVAESSYEQVKTQVAQAQEIQNLLQAKFTSVAFYDWMQGQLSGLYYQYYRFACDTARQAEQTMKRELMRPELDATSFIQFNYWDGGYKGLLSGEALYLDVKRMEATYRDNNKRELELTQHVSLRQLDPLALLTLRVTGTCTVTVPEWLYDRGCPGHYLRRIKTLSISVPSVTGPYTAVNCTATLQSSTIRVSPLLADGAYARATDHDDDRFVDSFGSTDVIVTSSGSNDSGMFEPDPRGERFLPFEGAGAISTWNLSLPTELPAFDYSTISDLILHIRYTARPAGNPLGAQATKELVGMLDTAGRSGQTLLFNLRYDFSTEWSAFINGAAGAAFTTTLSKQFFPYAVQSARKLTVDSVTLHADDAGSVVSVTPSVDLAALTAGLTGVAGEAALSLPADSNVLVQDPSRQVFLALRYHFGMS